MDIFVKASAVVLMAVVLSLVLSKYGRDYSIILIICVCVIVAGAAVNYLDAVIEFVHMLQEKGQLDGAFVSVLLKAVGIGILSEITMMICTDSGNAALGKVIQFLSTAVILWLCIPLFTELMSKIESILGNI